MTLLFPSCDVTRRVCLGLFDYKHLRVADLCDGWESMHIACDYRETVPNRSIPEPFFIAQYVQIRAIKAQILSSHHVPANQGFEHTLSELLAHESSKDGSSDHLPALQSGVCNTGKIIRVKYTRITPLVMHDTR